MTDQPNWTSLTRDQKGEAIRPHIEAGKLTYAQIAQLFGTTKNSISSTVARNGLVNPLTAGDKSLTPMQKAEKARLLRAKTAKLNTQRQIEKEKKQRARAAERKAAARQTPDHRAAPAIEPVHEMPDRRPPRPEAWIALPGTTPGPYETAMGCQWPINDDLPFLACNAPRQEHSPYCRDHHAMAYRPAPEVRLKRKKGQPA